ncbi:hypothetical protein [Glutamicibacter protophormiae]|uniref:hypothetical protein n=1 Tax=Glutamicibacter protophormiae TaxID=37930 RepID=UPI001959FAEC|nr:hypothetical protein [Glutamicibacter protophormiae]QRQ79439.1 hypothetical protein JQN66_04225 [Glutamicibacter protophormiae]
MEDEQLPVAHENFARHFTAPIYEEQADEFAPFGSDEGWDTLQAAAEKRTELLDGATVADVLDIVDGPAGDEWGDSPDAEEWYSDATFVAAAAFTLLRLTGQIDEIGRERGLEALDILIEYFGEEPELRQQKNDLERWSNIPGH